MAKVLVIIPAFNEAQNIERTVNEVRVKVKADILVVDDGSSDKTREKLEMLKVDYVPLPFNTGIGNAMQTGFKYAVDNEYDIAVQVDADGQHDPKYVDFMAGIIEKGNVDVVVGSRYLKRNNYKTPLIRLIGIKFFSLITSILINQRVTDVSSGYRAMSNKVMKSFYFNYPADFPDAEVLMRIKKNHFKMMEIPMQMRERELGKSSLGLIKTIYYPFNMLYSIIVLLLSWFIGGKND